MHPISPCGANKGFFGRINFSALCNPRLCPSDILLFLRSFLFLLLFFFPGSAFLWFLGTEAELVMLGFGACPFRD